MFNFGAGRARLVPAGSGYPVELGVVQSATLELKVDLKEARGAFRYPIAVADGKGTASGKVSFLQLWPQTITQITGGTQTNGTGTEHAAVAEAGTIRVSSPYTYTLANASTLVAGSEIVTVVYGSSPTFYARVSPGGETSPTTGGVVGGSYSIAAGVLTFATADAGLAVQVTYLYTVASDKDATTVALANVGMNTASTFALTLIGTAAKNRYNNTSQQFIVNLNACLAPSLKMDFKLDDFTGLDLDFQAFIDANGNLGNMYFVSPNG